MTSHMDQVVLATKLQRKQFCMQCCLWKSVPLLHQHVPREKRVCTLPVKRLSILQSDAISRHPPLNTP